MNKLLEQVERNIRAQDLFEPGQSVLVAVSGGVDSMVLLRALHLLAPAHHWTLTVGHLDHGLRGPESRSDRRFVGRAANRLHLRFVSQSVDAKAWAAKRGVSLEMGSRELRHRFLAETAASLGIQTVALAHHADDQVELFFLRLLRGTGSEGLSGMKWQNASPHDSACRLVRPLLESTREQILRFALEMRVSFREDTSNRSLKIRRNRIRHQLLPNLLRHHQPALGRVVRRFMQIVAAESEHITAEARAWLKAPQSTRFDRLPLALQRKTICLQLRHRAAPEDFELVERLRERPARPTVLRPGLAVILDENGRLRTLEVVDGLEFRDAEIKLNLHPAGGEAAFGDAKLRWQTTPAGDRPRRPQPKCEWFDAGKVGRRVCLRHWRKGDRFQPKGMPCPVKLQDLFTNLKVSKVRRHRLLIATTRQGEIWWVEGLRIGEQFKVTATTRSFLKWEWNRSGDFDGYDEYRPQPLEP